MFSFHSPAQSILSWFSQKSQSRSPQPSRSGALMAWNQAGKPVWTPRDYASLTEEGYQKNVIVYRCVNLISRNVATPPWILYQGDHEVETHPYRSLMETPNPLQTRSSFIEALAGYILLSGNAYIEAVGQAHVEELYLLRPDRVKVIPGRQGLPSAYIYEVNGKKRVIEGDAATGRCSVLHLKLFNPLNDWYGMSPIEAAASSIDQHNAVGSHNLSLLQNGGRPSGALVVKSANQHPHGNLSDKERLALKESLHEFYQGTKNAGRVLVLEGDLSWQEMGMSPKDLDFVEGKHLSSREIAQAYGVPTMLVGVPGDATFSNYKEARFHLWEDTVLPLLNMIMGEINRWLFSDNFGFSYDSDQIPALSIRREALWARIQASTFLTINEKRQALGYSPLEGEQGRTLQL